MLVTGATGFIGTALVRELLRTGRHPIVLSRNARRARTALGPDVRVVEDLGSIPADTRIDAIVNLAGSRVLGMPWNAARRRELLGSRVNVTAAVVALIHRLRQPPQVLVSASAVGFYGAPKIGSFEPLTEASPPRPGQFQSDLCAAVENEARLAEALGTRVVLMRFGVVLGRGGGAYPLQAASARLGLGSVLGSGRQPAPWVHLEDAVGLIRFALENDSLSGPVNAVAPETPSQAEFVKALAASFGRRVYLRIPDAPLRLLAGEMSTLLLDGQHVVPRVALTAGYEFRFSNLSEALADLAGHHRTEN